MTGPEHYREAERLLSGCEDIKAAAERMRSSASALTTALQVTVAQAQVHATLALAAATAADEANKYDGDETFQRSRGWAGVA